MNKLICDYQENIVECDSCDFVIPNKDPYNPLKDASQFINMPCPHCGDNLLTRRDYELDLKIMQKIDFINRWFSWLTIFGFGGCGDKTTLEIKVKEGKVLMNNGQHTCVEPDCNQPTHHAGMKCWNCSHPGI